MGMFDTLWVDCPVCGEQIEIQSKAGDCCLDSYNIFNIPLEIAKDLDKTYACCDNCDRTVRVKLLDEHCSCCQQQPCYVHLPKMSVELLDQ